MIQIEIQRAHKFVSDVLRIQNENVRRQHRHAMDIKSGRRPDVGLDRLLHAGLRYRHNFVSKEKHPIPSLSAIHTFEEKVAKPKPQLQLQPEDNAKNTPKKPMKAGVLGL